MKKKETKYDKKYDMWTINPVPACTNPMSKCKCKAWMNGHYVCIAKYVDEKREC